jgi:outer membrane protein insertion porin family
MFRTLARAVAAALPLLAAAAGAQPKVRIVVLPVVVHALEQQDYLQNGIADMLATRLEQNPKLDVVRVGDAAQATLDAEAARGVGRSLGAAYVVFGSFTRFGEGASLDLRCQGTEGPKGEDPRSVFVNAGSVGEIIPRLDDLAEKLGRYVTTGGGPPPVAAGPPGAPPSPPAEALGDALSELDELRARVERLEEVLYGRPGAGVPGAATPPEKRP